MNSRSRSVKPAWLDDTKTAEASLPARVLSIALLVMADDYGNGRLAKASHTRVFPNDPSLFAPAFEELSALGFAFSYVVDGQAYFSIVNWAKHQRVDKPGKPLVPGPSEGRVPFEETVPVAYFVRSEATGLIKIGKSIDPVRRLLELAKQSPDRLELLAVGGSETELHRELAQFRVHGEWFKPSAEVLSAAVRFGFDGKTPISAVGPENMHKTPVANSQGTLATSQRGFLPDKEKEKEKEKEKPGRENSRPETAKGRRCPCPPREELVDSGLEELCALEGLPDPHKHYDAMADIYAKSGTQWVGAKGWRAAYRGILRTNRNGWAVWSTGEAYHAACRRAGVSHAKVFTAPAPEPGPMPDGEPVSEESVASLFGLFAHLGAA